MVCVSRGAWRISVGAQFQQGCWDGSSSYGVDERTALLFLETIYPDLD
jgi:hypothetical protein